eukprot:scaffold24260_cov126-Isochrysis_galbana.AAC.11
MPASLFLFLPNPSFSFSFSFRLFSFSWIAQFFNISPSLPDRFAQLIRTITPSHLLDMLYASVVCRVYIVPPFNGTVESKVEHELKRPRRDEPAACTVANISWTTG